METPARRGLSVDPALALVALGGVVIAHGFGYGIAGIVDPSGHGYFDRLAPIVLSVTLLAASRLVFLPLKTCVGGDRAAHVRRIASARVRCAHAPLGPESRLAARPLTLRRLLGFQMVAYGWLEVSERLVSGEALTELASGPVLAGLVAQLPVAAALLALIDGSRRVVAAVLSIGRRLRPGTPRVRVHHRRAPHPRAVLVAGAASPRGPPFRSAC